MVIDTVPAHTLEIGDTFSYAGDEHTVIDFLESDDDTRVAMRTHSANSDMVEPLSIPWHVLVNILGA